MGTHVDSGEKFTIFLVLGSVRVWRGGEGKTEEPVLVTGWHLAPELVPQVESYFCLDDHSIMGEERPLFNTYCGFKPVDQSILSHFLEAECLLA